MNPMLEPYRRVDFIENYYQLLGRGDLWWAVLAAATVLAAAFFLKKRLLAGLQISPIWYFGILFFYGCACLFSLFLFEKHFQSGDIFVYQESVRAFRRAALADPANVWTMLRHPPPDWSAELQKHFLLGRSMLYFERIPTALVVRPAGLLSLVFGGSFVGCCLIFSGVSFFSGWWMFRHFALRFWTGRWWFLVATLLVPSVCFWNASGVLKEPLMMLALATFTTIFLAATDLKNLGKSNWRHWLLLVCSMSLIFFLKFFIAIALFLGCAAVGLQRFGGWFEQRRNGGGGGDAERRRGSKPRRRWMPATRPIFFYFLAVAAAAGLTFGIYKLNVEVRGTGAKNIAEDIANVKNVNVEISKRANGSTYEVSNFDGSAAGFVQAVGSSMGTTFFRPFVWEAKKMTTRLASFESFVTLILTLLVLFQTSVKNWFSIIWNNERLAFLLVYSLSTAVVIGYTAQNFGTLSRYKSLLLPFYFCALILFYLESKKAKTPNPINPKTNQPIH